VEGPATQTHVDDSELVAAARRGDRGAFEALLRPLIEPGYRLAFAMLGNRDEAEDAGQEASLRAWAAVRGLCPDTVTLRAPRIIRLFFTSSADGWAEDVSGPQDTKGLLRTTDGALTGHGWSCPPFAEPDGPSLDSHPSPPPSRWEGER
jgi:hypothetical protein